MEHTHPIDEALGAWLDALPRGALLRVPVRARWSPLGVTAAHIDGAADLTLALDDTAMGVPLLDHLRASGERLLLEGSWGRLVALPLLGAPERTLSVRCVVRPLGPDEVASVIRLR